MATTVQHGHYEAARRSGAARPQKETAPEHPKLPFEHFEQGFEQLEYIYLPEWPFTFTFITI